METRVKDQDVISFAFVSARQDPLLIHVSESVARQSDDIHSPLEAGQRVLRWLRNEYQRAKLQASSGLLMEIPNPVGSLELISWKLEDRRLLASLPGFMQGAMNADFKLVHCPVDKAPTVEAAKVKLGHESFMTAPDTAFSADNILHSCFGLSYGFHAAEITARADR
jgi:hypothetical protein